MPNKMLIDASHPEETRVVVVRGNRIEEFDFESQDKKQLKGNIYLARVTRVEPSGSLRTVTCSRWAEPITSGSVPGESALTRASGSGSSSGRPRRTASTSPAARRTWW